MSDEITVREDGFAEVAVYGEAPWHRLGQSVEAAMTSAEAMQQAGLDWEVAQQPVYVAVGEIPDYKAYIRSDTGAVMTIASNRFTPIQNSEAFDFMDSIVGERLAMYHTAGSLRKGKRIWLLAKLPGDYAIKDMDKVDKYLLLANGHDGTLALHVQWTPIRVVCSNTLTAALGTNGRSNSEKGQRSIAGQRFVTKHTTGITGRVNDAREMIGLSEAYFEQFMAQAEMIAAKELNHQQLYEMIGATIKLEANEVDQIIHSDKYMPHQRAIQDIRHLFEHGIGNDQPGIEHTGWAAYNAVTEYLDHSSETREKDPVGVGAADARMNRSWFGTGQEMRQRSWDYLTQRLS
jgi:phage/plasmid-like protein (TIGR03299 family)